jgi:hypothetical protein
MSGRIREDGFPIRLFQKALHRGFQTKLCHAFQRLDGIGIFNLVLHFIPPRTF